MTEYVGWVMANLRARDQRVRLIKLMTYTQKCLDTVEACGGDLSCIGGEVHGVPAVYVTVWGFVHTAGMFIPGKNKYGHSCHARLLCIVYMFFICYSMTSCTPCVLIL